MSDDARPALWKFWYWPARLWLLLIPGLLLLLPLAIRMTFLSIVPAMDEPFDVAQFVKDDPPDSENAFTEYRQASRMHDALVAGLRSRGTAEPDTYDTVFQNGWAAIDDPLRDWLDQHREAMTLWRLGTRKQRACEISLAAADFTSLLPTVQNQRMFVRLALLEEARCLHEGDTVEAWGWVRAAYRSGGHSTQRGCLIQGLVGYVLHAMSTQGMNRWADHSAVTSEQLKRALAEVREDKALYEPMSTTLKAEYLMFCNSFARPDWVQLMDPVSGVRVGSNAAKSVGARMSLWIVGEPELSTRFHRQILANQLPEVDKPVAERRKLAGSGVVMLFDPDPAIPLAPRQLDPVGIDRGLQCSFIAKVMLPTTKQVDNASLRRRGLQAAIEVVLAAQAFRRDHGEFPDTAELLIPNYLASIPLDPADPAGKPIRYRRDDSYHAAVWSVGDDGNDDDGAVEATNSRAPDAGFALGAKPTPPEAGNSTPAESETEPQPAK